MLQSIVSCWPTRIKECTKLYIAACMLVGLLLDVSEDRGITLDVSEYRGITLHVSEDRGITLDVSEDRGIMLRCI